MNLWSLGSVTYTAMADPEMPGKSARFLVAAGQTEGWLTLRATHSGFTSDFRVFVSSIVVKMDPPVVLLSVPEFEVGPTTATFTIEGPPGGIKYYVPRSPGGRGRAAPPRGAESPLTGGGHPAILPP